MARRPEKLAAPDGQPDAEVRPEQLSGLKAILQQRLLNLRPNHASSPKYGDSPRTGDHNPDAKAADNVASRSDDRDTSVDDLEPSFQAQVPAFDRLRDQHLARWPERERPDRQRPDDPPGSWRGDGGRYLAPEQNAEAAKLIAGLREHEAAITAKLKEIEKENPHGGVLVGLSHCLKGDDRLKEKIADSLSDDLGSTVADAVGRIWDAVRYTFRFEPGEYAAGYGDIRGRLEAAGQMAACHNRWKDPDYKGVNTKWAMSDGGRFELQFHTPESHYAKEHLTHKMYERLRSRETSWEELAGLNDLQHLVSASIPVPPGVERI